MKVYINGEFFEEDEAKISVLDHGLLYGDGIFEGIRLYKKCVFKLNEHLERLEHSAKAIMLELPWSREAIAEAVCETCRVNEVEDVYLRLLVTRGKGTLGFSPKSCSNPQLIILSDPGPFYSAEYYEEGIKLITVPTRRLSTAALSPQIKSLNYLNSILGKIECQHLGYSEALMLNEDGFVAECTGDNVFIIQKGQLLTPPSSAGILMGITRQTIIDIAERLGIPIKETPLSRYALWNADECFLTGTYAEIIPVKEMDGRTIGKACPGPLTKQFTEEFFKLNSKDGVKI
tara:strand:+ start:65832 stop:66698 length:867 start_codon:yes stop_codon:yes gene_type:complete